MQETVPVKKYSWHHYFPTTGIGFTTIPKNGCTSVRNYLYKLECQTNGEFTNQKLDEESIRIHKEQGLRKLKVESLSLKNINSLNVLVLRNPYLRTRSTWLNKLVYAQNHYSIYKRFEGEDFVPGHFSSLAELNEAFLNFTKKLKDNPMFLSADPHWTPQTQFFESLSDYNLVIETANLSILETQIRQHLAEKYRGLVTEVPQHNSTQSRLTELVGTSEAWANIRNAYDSDFELLERAGISIDTPEEVNVANDKEAQLVIAEAELIREARRLSEVKDLNFKLEKAKEELQNLKSSKSWKLTAWLRFLDGLLRNNRS